MIRHRLVRTWFLPLILALVATWSVRSYLTAAGAPPPPAHTAPVVVVTGAVPGRSIVAAGHITVKAMPVEFIPAGALGAIGDAVGRMSLVPLQPGEILLASKLAPPGEKPGLAHHVPEGKRAVTILVNEIIGAGGFIEPGDRVDIIATFRKDLTDLDRSQLLLQDILVLAVAQDTAVRYGPVREIRAYTSITLAVSPQEATRLVLAEERGSLRLLLRPWNDPQVVPFTETTTEAFRLPGR
ncbi:MAG: Flp pilus assembly protein CpaB [Bacillota bacterium]